MNIRDLDPDCYQALESYFKMGLEPGSLVRCAILGASLAELEGRAHPLLRKAQMYGMPYLSAMKILVDYYLPDFTRGTVENYQAWVDQGGRLGASDEQKVSIKLTAHWNDWNLDMGED